MTRTLNNSTVNQAKDQVTDMESFGDIDAWKLICKASSKSEMWMRSTKAMEIENVGCLVQVSTIQGSGSLDDPVWSVAEEVTFIPNVTIEEVKDEEGKLIGRVIVSSAQAQRKKRTLK